MGFSHGSPQDATAPKFPELPAPETNSTVKQPVIFVEVISNDCSSVPAYVPINGSALLSPS